MNPMPKRHDGFTLVELLLAVAIAGLLMAALSGVVSQALQARAAVQERNELLRDARFAMERMVSSVRGTTRLLVPLGENPTTAWSESVRDPGVLAMTLPPAIDRDQDGFADVDNDRDGRVDEDCRNDSSNDGAPGILGIDDDGDGLVDEGGDASDDDEDGFSDDDPLDGVDNDGDGATDEDNPADMNKDFAPGVAGVDDDGDGTIDEPPNGNNDEEGGQGDDWFDPVVYFVSGTDLIERMPNPHPSDGLDYTESVVAENVSTFRVERVPGARSVLVDITLEVTDPTSGESVSLHTRVRVGGGA